MQGITFSQSPFIRSILAPHLERKGLPLIFYESITEFISAFGDYSLLDGEDILEMNQDEKDTIKEALNYNNANIALVSKIDFREKLQLLNIGFSYCLELPISTEVVIKSIENTVKQKNSNRVKESRVSYGRENGLNYLINSEGSIFLSNARKSTYLSRREKLILDYLFNRKEFASRGELAYTGWKRFNVKANTITVTIKNLRKKLSYLRLPYRINNLYGFGYKLEKLNN